MQIKAKAENGLDQCQSVLTVAWISDFPLEWLSDLPTPLRLLPKQHPATWEMVLLSELENNPALRVHVLMLRKDIAKDFQFERNGVVFHVLKVLPGLRAPSLFWLDTFLISRALKKIKPDLVHAWGTEKGAGLVALRLCYPCLITIQGLLTWYQELVPLSKYEKFAALLEQRSLKRAQAATTESKFAVNFLHRKYPKLNIIQAEHAPNWYFHRIERRPQTKPIRFISVATLGFRKGTDLLFRALNQLSNDLDFELIVISDPNEYYLDSNKSILSPKLRSRTTFHAHLPPLKVAEELASATMLLLPTRADTSPNAVKEAVVAGVPVVASAIGGIVDYVFPGENGFLFQSDSFDGFLTSIRSACEHPLFSKGLVNEETLERTREYLSPKRMGENFLSIYKSTIVENPSGLPQSPQ